MTAPVIKICGLVEPADVAHAVACGATHVGVIRAASSRRFVPESLREAWIRAAGATPRVGVYVDVEGHEDAVLEDAARWDLQVIQVHDGRSHASLRRLRAGFGGALWWAHPVEDGVPAPLPDGLDADAVLVDTVVAGQFGGTGVAHGGDHRPVPGRPADWTCALPLLVAGGLTPDNVLEHLRAWQAAGVDVSSGVETPAAPGSPRPRKDAVKVARFVTRARQALFPDTPDVSDEPAHR
jgi:phosphoribosylanthranilate isomerase